MGFHETSLLEKVKELYKCAATIDLLIGYIKQEISDELELDEAEWLRFATHVGSLLGHYGAAVLDSSEREELVEYVQNLALEITGNFESETELDKKYLN
jgi:hypothetical protein